MIPLITLRITTPDGRMEMVQFEKDRVTFGRASSTDLPFADNLLARTHGAFLFFDGVLIARDHSTTNGTQYKNRNITDLVLPPGESVVAGAVRFENAQTQTSYDEALTRHHKYVSDPARTQADLARYFAHRDPRVLATLMQRKEVSLEFIFPRIDAEQALQLFQREAFIDELQASPKLFQSISQQVFFALFTAPQVPEALAFQWFQQREDRWSFDPTLHDVPLPAWLEEALCFAHRPMVYSIALSARSKPVLEHFAHSRHPSLRNTVSQNRACSSTLRFEAQRPRPRSIATASNPHWSELLQQLQSTQWLAPSAEFEQLTPSALRRIEECVDELAGWILPSEKRFSLEIVRTPTELYHQWHHAWFTLGTSSTQPPRLASIASIEALARHDVRPPENYLRSQALLELVGNRRERNALWRTLKDRSVDAPAERLVDAQHAWLAQTESSDGSSPWKALLDLWMLGTMPLLLPEQRIVLYVPIRTQHGLLLAPDETNNALPTEDDSLLPCGLAQILSTAFELGQTPAAEKKQGPAQVSLRRWDDRDWNNRVLLPFEVGTFAFNGTDLRMSDVRDPICFFRYQHGGVSIQRAEQYRENVIVDFYIPNQLDTSSITLAPLEDLQLNIHAKGSNRVRVGNTFLEFFKTP